MAKKIGTYVVADGCIQEGSVVFIKGDPYTPPSVQLEKELLAAGVIAVSDQDAALANADADALADAEAKAAIDLLGPGQ